MAVRVVPPDSDHLYFNLSKQLFGHFFLPRQLHKTHQAGRLTIKPGTGLKPNIG